MSFRRIAYLLVLAAGLLASSPARGTVMLYLSADELADQAPLVVRGRVLRQQVVLDEGSLWTDSYLEAEEAIKGHAPRGKVMIVRQPGGETFDRGLHVAGAARFAPGEEVLVFARPVRGFFVLLGMSQGKYSIRRGSDGRDEAVRDFNGAAIARPGEDLGRQLSTGVARLAGDRMPLSELVALVRARGTTGGVR